jgi:hypothetical protein
MSKLSFWAQRSGIRNEDSCAALRLTLRQGRAPSMRATGDNVRQRLDTGFREGLGNCATA